MKTYWNDQTLDTRKRYKIDTVNSTIGKGKPWHVTSLKYHKEFKVFTFESTINGKVMGMTESSVVHITEEHE